MAREPIFVSVIVSTYNWPEALKAVLLGLESQDYLLSNFEVVVADDGSGEATRELIQYFQDRRKIKIRHVWQSDDGFQLSKIRNKAILEAEGEYLIFIDGDSVPLPGFIRRHVALAESACFVTGTRVLLNAAFSSLVLKTNLPIHLYSFGQFMKAYCQGKINRILSLFPLPLGYFRFLSAFQWKGAKGCNLAFWKKDLLAVNGFDESYVGWGYEDSDLIVRLFHLGIRRKSGKFAVPVLHLWHPESSRAGANVNYEKLMAVTRSTKVKATSGLSQYS
jgi:glycosyltransferase involved in cell wall biosynthesis